MNYWDNGYPSGGNYWSDYTGADNNHDGIGDTPYYIPDENNKDNYPLMHQYGPPYAEFTSTVHDRTVTFNASRSHDYDGIIILFEWDFGDNTSGTGMIINHTYTDYGSHTIILTVTDNDGKVDSVSKIISESPPYIPSSPDPTNGSTEVNINANLNWVGGDPDEDPVTYDVYFGATSQPLKVASNQSATTYDPGTMNYNVQYYWRIVAWDNNGASTLGSIWSFTTKASTPPVFGTPSPLNGSTGNPSSFTWSIPINDPEGDLFSWTIQCSSGQTNSATGATNGTKTLSLTGLPYSTTYKVWVNATDPGGSGLYTRRWYTFTTKASLPPVFGTPTPANGSTNQPISFTWSILINDPEGDLFSWTIQCSNGQTNSATGATNGTKTLALSGLAYSTTYKVWVNATDPTGSGMYTRKWYTFTTKANQPPNPPTIHGAASGKAKQKYDYTFNSTDPNGDNVFYYIDWGDNSNSGWIGPYSSGVAITQSHTWSNKGTYTIKAKAKDIYGNESDWGTLSVTMPLSYEPPHFRFFAWLFERFPHAFPILRQLLGY
jgi:hypothetical protein